jgi:hypothetical protein
MKQKGKTAKIEMFAIAPSQETATVFSRGREKFLPKEARSK